MYHLELKDKETGETKINADVMFLTGVFGDNEKNTRFCQACSADNKMVESMIAQLFAEAHYLTENYLNL